MTTPLDEQSVIAYAQSRPELTEGIFQGVTELAATALTEGNVNLIFRVFSPADPQNKSVIVKQALPHSWRYPDLIMPVERSRIEYEVLQLEARYCHDQTVRMYFHDAERNINAFEDLNRHLVMRDGLMQQKIYPLVAQHIGTFMARTLFYTSDLYLSSGEKKALVPRFVNAGMVKVQEDLVFTQPVQPHPNNRWTEGIEPQVQAIYADDSIRADIFLLKEKYMTNAQALIHNDLHTGSILINAHETKVIDPEFAFFGPIAHDVGSYIANLAIAYAAQEFHAPNDAARADYRVWLMSTLAETWNIFHAEFVRLWETDGNGEWPSPTFRKNYMHALLQDTTGFAAAEIYRRLIGLAHVSDFWNITDKPVRARAESLGVNIATAWLKARRGVTTINDLTDMMSAARATYP